MFSGRSQASYCLVLRGEDKKNNEMGLVIFFC